MKKATAEWLKSAEMDLDNIAQIIDLEHLTPIAAFHAHMRREMQGSSKNIEEGAEGSLDVSCTLAS